jgi:hypothetical protein
MLKESLSNLRGVQLKYAKEIGVMKAFLKTQHPNRMSLAQFTRQFVRWCRDDQTVMWWIQPGYRRIKAFLIQHGFSIGTKNRQTIILCDTDPELSFQELSGSVSVVQERQPTMSKEQLAGAWGYGT